MTEPEFSRPIEVEALPNEITEMEIEANEQEQAALAQRFSLLSLDSLKARLRLKKPENGGPVELDARITAKLTQTCVVTLEPVKNSIESAFSCIFAGEESEAVGTELDIDPDAADPPEPLVDGQFDAGELVAEYFGLEIDPFPRAPEADFDRETEGQNINKPEDASPFAALRELSPEKK
ncbi:MAG: DUF177 domain-containing protein [Rhodospirillaceae bacterium]|jgi:uncharacterized metal-binding protein YceD (DUF177 family)